MEPGSSIATFPVWAPTTLHPARASIAATTATDDFRMAGLLLLRDCGRNPTGTARPVPCASAGESCDRVRADASVLSSGRDAARFRSNAIKGPSGAVRPCQTDDRPPILLATMSITDRYGLPVSTGSPIAAERFQQGMDALLAFGPG